MFRFIEFYTVAIEINIHCTNFVLSVFALKFLLFPGQRYSR